MEITEAKKLLEPLFPRYFFEIWRPNLLGMRHFDLSRYEFGDKNDCFMVEFKDEKIRFLPNIAGKAPWRDEKIEEAPIIEFPHNVDPEKLVQTIKNLIAMHRFTIV